MQFEVYFLFLLAELHSRVNLDPENHHLCRLAFGENAVNIFVAG